MENQGDIRLILEQKEHYLNIFRSAHIPIVVTDEKGYVVDFNKAANEQTGYTAEEYAKINMSQIDVTRNTKEEIAKIVKQIHDNGFAVFEALHRTKTGKVLNIIVNSSLLEVGGKKYNLAIFNDITSNKKTEHRLLEELTVKNEKLEELNTELNHFAYIAAHNLNEPLRTIDNFVGIIKEEYHNTKDESINHYFSVIHKATHRMRIMIDSLLAYSKIGKYEDFEQSNLNQIISSVEEDLSKIIEENQVSFKKSVLPQIICSHLGISQVFQNLISNSIKFQAPNSKPIIEISCQENPTNWQFCVSDNGIGIIQEKQKIIFQMFTKLHKSTKFEGHGIGLAFCKKIIELHKGNVWIKSTPDVGSQFYFTISKDLKVKN
ncbi:MAG: hypothetical protein CMO01_15630 [Thalassobius sp.]|nr:hypothetical protein [Thalassovita sp.]